MGAPGWTEKTLLDGRPYYSDGRWRKDEFHRPVVAHKWHPQYLSRSDREQDDQVAKERRAAGRQCQKCVLIYTDQEMTRHIMTSNKLKTCSSCMRTAANSVKLGCLEKSLPKLMF